MEKKDIKEGVLERLITFKEYTGLNLNAFCTSIEMGHTTVFNQFSGNRALSLDTVLHAVSAHGELSAEWLLRGKGDMIVSNENNHEDTTRRFQTRIEGLLETIQILSDTIRTKSATIDDLQAELNQFKSQKA